MLIKFPDRESASAAAAELIANILKKQLVRQTSATLIVSGGNSPIRCFEILAASVLDWSRVFISLSDERCVPNDQPESNEKLIRDYLMTGGAVKAHFMELESGVFEDKTITCCLLGMGVDGHFASIFPDSPQLDSALTGTGDVIQVTTPSSPFPRVSMTLRAILKSQEIILLAFGEEKRQILDNPRDYPVEHLMRNFPLKIIWAP